MVETSPNTTAPSTRRRFDALFATRRNAATVKLVPLPRSQAAAWLAEQSAADRAWAKSLGFVGRAGQSLQLRGDEGALAAIAFVLPDTPTIWDWATLPGGLPVGRYELDTAHFPDASGVDAALGWALAGYAFDRYKASARAPRVLVWPAAIDRAHVRRLAMATYTVRDLVNTPANDLGPAELEDAIRAIGARFGAKVTSVVGASLLKRGFPSVHAVGRAAVKARAPRIIELRWGSRGPLVTLVGKGVVFDSGGLDLKPASAMLLMKKDMGGAAHAIAVAEAVMDAKLPVRLRLLVPAVENAVAGDAFRPLDVLPTRRGLTVEVGNTDAEGRLILSDALTYADEESPDLIIDFATLTGAARVALGTDVPALFSNDDELAGDLELAAKESGDPMWRMPLHRPYARQLESSVADLSNVGSGRFGGAITAALFLERFLLDKKGQPPTPWAHFDVMAYNNERRPGRPKGGEAMGVRAVFRMLTRRYGR